MEYGVEKGQIIKQSYFTNDAINGECKVWHDN